MVPLSVLDLCPVISGGTPSEAIRASLALAKRVDELGYTRYWFAEHHNTRGIASSSPEVLIGHIAATTRRMRVGAGGIMLPNHAPLRVVETFRTLEAIHPGRIDLALGRSLGADAITSSALRKRPAGDDADEQLIELLAFALGEFPEEHPFSSIVPMPSDVKMPPLWMLGSSSSGAALAASLGVGFAFGGHFNMAGAARAVAVYRSQFKPSDEVPEPRLIVSVWVVCGENDAESAELAASLRLAYARITLGGGGPFPTLAEAHAHEWTREERVAAAHFEKGVIVGGPERVGEGLERLARETGADEIIVTTVIPSADDRQSSYERIAKLAGLSA